jgi:hypothetical protein
MSQQTTIPPNVKRELHRALEAALVINPDGTSRYRILTESDHTIAHRFGIKLWTVQSHRRQFFGPGGGKDSNKNPMANVWSHLEVLKAEIEQLKEKVRVLERNVYLSQPEEANDKLSSTPKQ